jgi:hypothetical protein
MVFPADTSMAGLGSQRVQTYGFDNSNVSGTNNTTNRFMILPNQYQFGVYQYCVYSTRESHHQVVHLQRALQALNCYPT